MTRYKDVKQRADDWGKQPVGDPHSSQTTRVTSKVMHVHDHDCSHYGVLTQKGAHSKGCSHNNRLHTHCVQRHNARTAPSDATKRKHTAGKPACLANNGCMSFAAG